MHDPNDPSSILHLIWHNSLELFLKGMTIKMKLTCIRYGSTYLKERDALSGGRIDVELPISLLFFLAETEESKILIDVGCDTMPGFFLREHVSPVIALEALGLSRNDITHIILTHAHHDHAQCAHYYPNAEIIMHNDAYKCAKQYLADGQKVTLFDNEYIPCDGITVTYIGGHADGSCIVTLNDGKNRAVLCGDECYVRESLTEKRLSGAVRDKIAAMKFIEKYCNDKDTILFHDDLLVGGLGNVVLF